MTKKNSKASTKGNRPSQRSPLDLEVEVKIRCDDVDRLFASELTVELIEDRHFEDNYVFQLPDGKLRKGQYLRIRHTGDGEGYGRRRAGVLTYKGKPRRVTTADGAKNKGKKVREEIETTVGQPPKLVKILKRLGLKRSFRYQKYRTIFSVTLVDGRSLEAMYDETPIGNFLELEGDASVIEAVAAELGYGQSHFVTDSYVEMYMKRGEPASDMLFEATKERQAKKRARGEVLAPKAAAKSRKVSAAESSDMSVAASAVAKPKKSGSRSKRKPSKEKSKVVSSKKAPTTSKSSKSAAKSSASAKASRSATPKPKAAKKKAAAGTSAKRESRSKKSTNTTAASPKAASKRATGNGATRAALHTSKAKVAPNGNGNGAVHGRKKQGIGLDVAVPTAPPTQPLRARARGAGN